MASTPLLGLSLPADGTTNWGTLVNTSITALLDSAIAGTTTLSSDADVTLTTTTEAANEARQAILLCTGARTSVRTITAPAQSKIYVVINSTTGGYGVKIVGVGPTTGITVPNGKTYMVAWNGSDFVTTNITSINLATDVSGTLPIANGGTGQTTQQAAINALAGAVTSGQYLRGNGTNVSMSAIQVADVPTLNQNTTGTASNVTGTVAIANGGTGQTTYTDGQLLIGNTSTNGLTKATLTPGSGVSISNGNGSITISATGSGGTVTSVSFTGGIISVATATTTPALTVAGTSGGIPYFSSGTTWASSAALAANAIVLGGGAGVAPATTTTGTGVVTAIGNSVNTSGGLVTQSGTLASSAIVLGGGSGSAVTSTTTGAGVVTAIGNAVNTTGGLVTQSGTLALSALLLGGGSGSAITSTTTGTGVVTALGNNANATGGFTTINGTATLTNKRIDPRTSTTTATATLTPDISSFDQYNLTAQDQALTVAAPTGTPVDGNKLILRILDNGTARAITWNATYTAIGTTLPTTTTANKMIYVGCIYNSTNTRWDVIAVTTQA